MSPHSAAYPDDRAGQVVRFCGTSDGPMTSVTARISENYAFPIDIGAGLAYLRSAQDGAVAMASAIPALMSAARYRSVVAARVLGAADPDEAARVLRKHRNTHAVLLGAMLGASRSSTPSQYDGQSNSLLDVFESTKTSLSEAGQLILATTLLYLTHETGESSRVNATEQGQAEWSRVLDEEAWNATFDRLGAFICLALAPELGHNNPEISDRLAWEAWRAGTVMWPLVENARRRLQVVDRSFHVSEPEPTLLDYLDAVSAEELVEWIADDDALDTFTGMGAEP